MATREELFDTLMSDLRDLRKYRDIFGEWIRSKDVEQLIKTYEKLANKK
ncbi:TPA: hypothetical protein HA241_03600 [Candidatus Woesearchaeota archaeon]|nr:hypothetical protein [Candidatus Woesearchaeota archaeon]